MTLWLLSLLSIFLPSETEDFVKRLNRSFALNRLRMRPALFRAALFALPGPFTTFPCFVGTVALDINLIFQGKSPFIFPSIVSGTALILHIELIQTILMITRPQMYIVREKNGTWKLTKKTEPGN